MTTPAERQKLLSQVSRLAISDFRKLWAQTGRLPESEFRRYLLDAFGDLIDPYIAAAGELAAVWYEESLPESSYVAVTAPPIPEERMAGSVRWALSNDAAQTLLEGSLQRAVFDGARDTTLLNVEREGAKWARYASANACEFCKMLASRKAVYNSARSAVSVVGRGKAVETNFTAEGKRKSGGQAKGVQVRGTQKLGDKYHDNCHCVAVEVRSGQTYEPPAYVEQWEAEYVKAWNAVPEGTSYADNGVIKRLMAEWRQLDK